MIMKEIADRLRQARIDREKTVRRKKTGILALGVTIGAVAGVLLAPKAGKETREDLSQRGSEAWEKIKDASHTGRRLVSAVEERSSRVRTAAKGALNQRKRPVNPTFSHPSAHGMLITDIQVL